MKKQNEKTKEMCSLKGNILDLVVILEGRLDDLIATFFIKSQLEEKFLEDVLKQEFFTLSQKIFLLRRLNLRDNIKRSIKKRALQIDPGCII